MQVFKQALVYEVISDPAAFKASPTTDKYDIDVVTNEFLERAPRNAIIAKILNDGQGHKGKMLMCLPFFPPHLCFPVKPGEHVWLVSPAPHEEYASQYYWMCRVPQYDDVDDLNYTVNSRWLSYTKPKPAEISGAEAEKDSGATNELLFGFPNGTGLNPDGQAVAGGEHAYSSIISDSLAMRSFKFEPVPRLSKRPGDFVIQGSNNTAIILGTNRGEPGGFKGKPDAERFKDFKATPPGEEAEIFARSSATMIDPTAEELNKPKHDDNHGAIDIVVGRGLRVRKNAAAASFPTEDFAPGDTAIAEGHGPTFPGVKKIINPSDSELTDLDDAPDKGEDLSAIAESGMDLIEVAKNRQAYEKDIENNHFDHAIEGDPDFRYDAARIYISSDSEPDTDFGLDEQLGDFAPNPLQKKEGDAPHPLAGSSIVSKADHIRIIARKDPADVPKASANGSIRIIKEGDVPSLEGAESDGERAIISIEPNGTIYIDGPRIVIGNGRLTPPTGASSAGGSGGGKGAGQHVFIGGEDAVESAVLGEAFADAILAFAGNVMAAIGGVGIQVPSMDTEIKATTPALTAALANMGGPIFHPTAQAALDALHNDLTNALSKTTKTK